VHVGYQGAAPTRARGICDNSGSCHWRHERRTPRRVCYVPRLLAFTVFLGAFLLFAVQPLAGRYILPWLGGGAGVWTACLLFFQVVLVAGYAYAHVIGGHRRGRSIHIALLIACLPLLPVRPDAAHAFFTAEARPTLDVLVLLATSVGPPYFLLCATAPLLQRWYSRAHEGRSPYRLYALSNAGSLIALLTYPVLVEPALGRDAQVDVWSSLFVVFAIGCGVVAWRARDDDGEAEGHGDEPRPTGRRTLLWVALSASAATLLVAVTNQLSSDVAAVPLLWVIPLAIYLLTFILAFAVRGGTSRVALLLALAFIAPLVVASLFEDHIISLQQELPVLCAALFASCLLCHGELARTKPSPVYLTRFFVFVALGGALGGAFAALVAPVLFSGYWELHLSFSACVALGVARAWVERGRGRVWLWAATLGTGLLVVSLALHVGEQGRGIIDVERNFYGVIRVQEDVLSDDVTRRRLLHGFVNHGSQHFTADGPSRVPGTYFSAESGVARAITRHPRRQAGQPLDVLVIGLGVGALAAWGEPGDRFDFVEINPAVERAARTHFTYLKDSKARTSVVIGDGRRVVEANNAQRQTARYDVLVLDAFSGDAVPLHLLTVDAARIWWAALKPGGVLAFNLTNRFVDLEPVVRGLAEEVGAHLVVLDSGEDELVSDSSLPARWAVLIRDNASLADDLGGASGSGPSLRWTDDDTSLVKILK
jgi:hypothetical protein